MTIDKKSLINWVGGKRLLRKTNAPLIPKDILSYVEPFGGAGWVFFYNDKWAELEIYNDLDGRLVNLFRIVKYHPEALKEELKFQLLFLLDLVPLRRVVESWYTRLLLRLLTEHDEQ